MKPLLTLLLALLAILAPLSEIAAAAAATAAPPEAPDAAAATTKPGDAEQPSSKAPIVLPLSRVEPVPIKPVSIEDIARLFPAFDHEPYETSGFNCVTLPFLYLRRGGEGYPEEALAFSFLLSNSLDWAPGGYCTRHAYFTFKRARRYMEELAQRYNPATIRMAIEDWETTHALGGTLIKAVGGYAATLRVYDRDARVVFEKKYGTPRDYFDLLGDVSVDAIRFLGKVEPSPALVDLLHVRRCTKHESIRDLGRAAFAEEKTPAEFGLYERILKRDPGFADVRYWYANQRQWQDGDRARYMAEIERAMTSYPVEAAAVDFIPKEHPDPSTARKKDTLYKKRLEELAGPHLPDLVYCELRNAWEQKQLEASLRQRALHAAREYPNEYWLHYYLGELVRAVLNDADSCNRILIAALRSNYLPSIDHRDVTLALSYSLMDTGRQDLSVPLCYPFLTSIDRKAGSREAFWYAHPVGVALHETGHHAEALVVFPIEVAGRGPGNDRYAEALVLRGIAAAHAGNLHVLEATIDDHKHRIEKDGVLFLLEGYRELLHGRRVDPKQMYGHSRGCPYWAVVEAAILAAQADILAGTRKMWNDLRWLVKLNSQNRPIRLLYDQYQRAKPSGDDACFYGMLEWLYAFDPAARQAVADFRKRSQEQNLAPPWPPEKVADLLKGFGTERYPHTTEDRKKPAKEIISKNLPPGVVASALRALLEQKRFDDAETLALRHHHLAVDNRGFTRLLYANHLIHLVQQARQQATDSQTTEVLVKATR